MRRAIAVGVLVTLAASGCADETDTPASVQPVTLGTATGPICPCWDEEALVGALPQADACVDETASATPFLSVDLFDSSAATQTQAFTRYDGSSEEGGSCRLAVVGTAGLVNEIAASSGLPRAAFEGCVALLTARARATAAGC